MQKANVLELTDSHEDKLSVDDLLEIAREDNEENKDRQENGDHGHVITLAG